MRVYTGPDGSQSFADTEIIHVAVMHFNAGNDVNGNSRRLYVMVHGGQVIAVADEGHIGNAARSEMIEEWERTHPHSRVQVVADAPTINITPGEYRRLRKYAAPTNSQR